METIEPPIYAPDCPARAILDRVADTWTTLVIGILAAVPSARFTELRRAIGGISQKMLTQTLRHLERDGLVTRRAYAVIPPRVEYALTPLGRTLCAPLHALETWAQEHVEEIRAAQQRFDGERASSSSVDSGRPRSA